MTRITTIDPAGMTAEQARVYDAALQAGAPVGGPYVAFIRFPKLFEAFQELKDCLSSGPMSPREQQIVNLAVARHWNAGYPWVAQVRRALAVGLDQAVIDAINARKTPHLADIRERTCFIVTGELLTNKGLSDESYADAERILGVEYLVALVATIGRFSMTCMATSMFKITAPSDSPTPLAQ